MSINYTEQIKFRTEIGRELLNPEVDDNFRFVANPWSPNRTYKKGMIVYHETPIVETGSTSSLTGVFWFIAKDTTTKGVFIDSEWEVFGRGNEITTSGLILNAFDKILVNSTSSPTLSASNNTLLQATGEDIFEIVKGDGLNIRHDISKNLIRFDVQLNPNLNSTSFELELGGESVDLSPLAGGYWMYDGSSNIYPVNLTDKVAIGGTSATKELDIYGELRIRGLTTGSSNNVLISDINGNISEREINPGVWNASDNIVIGDGTLNYIAKWTPDGNTIGNSIIYDNGTNVGIGTSSPSEILHLNGAIKIGTASNGTNGSIRWSGTDLEGRVGGTWLSLTSANIDTEEVQDIVGDMISSNIETGISVTYNDTSGKLNFILDSFTLELDGEITGSVNIDWSTNTYTLTTTGSTVNVELGTDTTGDYVESLQAGSGITITNNTGEGSTPNITLNTDEYTISKINTSNSIEVIRVPGNHYITNGLGLTVTNDTVPFNGSLDLTNNISIKVDTVGGLNLAKVINVNSNGLSIKIDDFTIIENSSGQLEIGTISTSNLDYNSIELNGYTIELGDSFDLELEDLLDVNYTTAGVQVGQVLSYTSLGTWEPVDMNTITGNIGEIVFIDGIGDPVTSSYFKFDNISTDKTLHVEGNVQSNKNIILNANFTSPGDFKNIFLSSIANTLDESIIEMYPDGVSEDIYVPNNSVVSFRIKITAIRTGGISSIGNAGDIWVHQYEGTFKNISGVTSQVGDITDTTISEDTDASLWNAFISADNVNDKLKIEVQGLQDTDIRWGSLIELTIIQF